MNTAEIRSSLETLRDDLRSQLSSMGASPDDESMDEPDLDTQFADAAQTAAERDKDLRLIENLREQLTSATRALERIDEGTYGTCERCGAQIPPERLEALPYVTLCLDCKQKAG